MKIGILIFLFSIIPLLADENDRIVTENTFTIISSPKIYAEILFESKVFVLHTEKGNVKISLLDGSVKIDEGVDVNEAAKVFWKAVEAMHPK